MKTAEEELQKIIRLHFNTAFERRMEALKGEIQAADDEFRLAGALHSGAFVKRLIELRCKAIRDIVSTTFETAREKRVEHRLPWTEEGLSATTNSFDELIEDLFSGQKAFLQEELSRKYRSSASPQAWALQEMDEEKLRLQAEVSRKIEILRSGEKIKAIAGAQTRDIPTLGDLRKGLTDTQRKILNRIWAYYQSQTKWIPARVIHRELGKEAVLSAVKSLGGSVVRKTFDPTQRECYEVTLLGVVLSDDGQEAEDLLARYFDYVRSQFLQNPEIGKVTGEEVKQAIQLTDEQKRFLAQLIQLGSFWTGHASFGENWECGVPSDIDDLPAVADLHTYVQEKILETYDPKVPIDPSDRQRYLATRKTKDGGTDLDFIQDPVLRDQLASDWDEVKRVREVKAWKSCVILCGGILEGMLLDVLTRDEPQAKAAYHKLKTKSPLDLNSWDLVDLVDVAKDLGLLSKGVVHLGHGLREFRNLVHPGKQIREKVSLTEQEADIAFRVVQVCLREFSSKFRTT